MDEKCEPVQTIRFKKPTLQDTIVIATGAKGPTVNAVTYGREQATIRVFNGTGNDALLFDASGVFGPAGGVIPVAPNWGTVLVVTSGLTLGVYYEFDVVAVTDSANVFAVPEGDAVRPRIIIISPSLHDE